jgi:hypothetical protein
VFGFDRQDGLPGKLFIERLEDDWVGVPEMTPLDESIDRPGGRLRASHVYGAAPTAADSDTLTNLAAWSVRLLTATRGCAVPIARENSWPIDTKVRLVRPTASVGLVTN